MPIPVMVIVCVHHMERCVYTVTAAVYSMMTVSCLSDFIWASTQKKTVFGSMGTTEVQTSLLFGAVWSAPFYSLI